MNQLEPQVEQAISANEREQIFEHWTGGCLCALACFPSDSEDEFGRRLA